MENSGKFVRTLWGIYDTLGRRFWQRRRKLDNDILLNLKIENRINFVCLTFGEENHKYLLDRNIESILIDKRPYVWDMDTQQFRHKLEVFKLGTEMYNEIVFLDWDCLPVKKVPENFWSIIRKKSEFQALLRSYRNKKIYWIRENRNCVPCASFIYLRNKDMANGFIKTWEDLGKPFSEEVTIAKYIDNIHGGWKGLDFWWEHYEPMCFNLFQGKVWTKEQMLKKDVIFEHFNHHGISWHLNRIKKKENKK